jgi:hypothetical protein
MFDGKILMGSEREREREKGISRMHQIEDVPSSERTGAPEEARLYSFRVPAVMLLRFRTTDSRQKINERVGLSVVRRFTTRILQQKKSTRNIRAVLVQDLDQRRMDESFHTTDPK